MSNYLYYPSIWERLKCKVGRHDWALQQTALIDRYMPPWYLCRCCLKKKDWDTEFYFNYVHERLEIRDE